MLTKSFRSPRGHVFMITTMLLFTTKTKYFSYFRFWRFSAHVTHRAHKFQMKPKGHVLRIIAMQTITDNAAIFLFQSISWVAAVMFRSYSHKHDSNAFVRIKCQPKHKFYRKPPPSLLLFLSFFFKKNIYLAVLFGWTLSKKVLIVVSNIKFCEIYNKINL